jgi:YVTN family beta-propeller protein
MLLGTIILISIIISSYRIDAQTLEQIQSERSASKDNAQIESGGTMDDTQIIPQGCKGGNVDIKGDIAIDQYLNKIYVTYPNLNTLSILDSRSGNITKNIRVGLTPTDIAVDTFSNKIYVANTGSNTVSVMDGINDHKEVDIPVGRCPISIAINPFGQVYVADHDDDSVSIISRTTNMNIKNIHVGRGPIALSIDLGSDETFVANQDDDSVTVIDDTKDWHIKNIPVGRGPIAIADTTPEEFNSGKVYVVNEYNNTVSVIDPINDRNIKNITVGRGPNAIDINRNTGLAYIRNSGTVSVIKGTNYKVASGIIFNVSPGNSGNIVCNSYNNPGVYNNTYPTNTYLYAESGTKCYAKPNKDYAFSSWVQNLGHNSTDTLNTTAVSDSPWNSFLRLIGREPNDPSTTFDVNGYGTFTANFKPLPPALPAEYWIPLYGIIVSSIVGWSIPSIIGAVKTKRQDGKSNQYYKRINDLYSDGKLDEKDIADLDGLKTDITTASMKGKISDQHSVKLNNEISALYEEIYKKRIDSLNDNKKLLCEIKNEIRDAFAKEKINEQHYKLLIEKVSERIKANFLD